MDGIMQISWFDFSSSERSKVFSVMDLCSEDTTLGWEPGEFTDDSQTALALKGVFLQNFCLSNSRYPETDDQSKRNDIVV